MSPRCSEAVHRLGLALERLTGFSFSILAARAVPCNNDRNNFLGCRELLALGCAHTPVLTLSAEVTDLLPSCPGGSGGAALLPPCPCPRERHILTEFEQLAGGGRGVKPGLTRARAGFSLSSCWELSCERCGVQVRLGRPSRDPHSLL